MTPPRRNGFEAEARAGADWVSDVLSAGEPGGSPSPAVAGPSRQLGEPGRPSLSGGAGRAAVWPLEARAQAW